MWSAAMAATTWSELTHRLQELYATLSESIPVPNRGYARLYVDVTFHKMEELQAQVAQSTAACRSAAVTYAQKIYGHPNFARVARLLLLDIVTILLSRMWHDMLSTSIFRLHPGHFCSQDDECSAEASFRRKFIYALFMLMPAAFIRYASASGPVVLMHEFKCVFPAAASYLVGWALGDAFVQLQSDLREGWASGLCTVLITTSTGGSLDCTWADVASAIGITCIAALVILRLRPLTKQTEIVDSEVLSSLDAGLDATWQLVSMALPLCILAVWHNTLSKMVLVGTPVVPEPVVSVHLLLFWAMAVSLLGRCVSKRLQNREAELRTQMKVVQEEARLEDAARMQEAQAAARVKAARALEVAEEVKAREAALAAANSRLEEARKLKQNVEMELAAVSARKLSLEERRIDLANISGDGPAGASKTELKQKGFLDKWMTYFPVFPVPVPSFLKSDRVERNESSGNELDDAALSIRPAGMLSSRWRPDPDGTGFVRILTPREGEELQEGHEQVGTAAISQSLPSSSTKALDAVAKEAALPKPVRLPMPSSPTLMGKSPPESVKSGSPMHVLAWEAGVRAHPKSPPSYASPPPSPPIPGPIPAPVPGPGVVLVVPVDRERLFDAEVQSLATFIGSQAFSPKHNSPKVFNLSVFIDLCLVARAALSWFAAWAWIDVAAMLCPLNSAPTPRIVVLNALAITSIALVAFWFLVVTGAESSFVTNSLSFFVSYALSLLLRDLYVPLAYFLANAYSLLFSVFASNSAGASSFSAAGDFTSAVICLPCFTWALYLAIQKYSAATSPAAGAQDTLALLASNTRSDAAMLNA